jgi:hypothetical protein
MEKNNILAVVNFKTGTTGPMLGALLAETIAVVGKIHLVYSDKAIADGKQLDLFIPRSLDVVKHRNKTPAQVLNTINRPDALTLPEHYDVVVYMDTGLDLKKGALEGLIKQTNELKVLQILREPPTHGETVKRVQAWLKQQPDSKEAGASLAIFARNDFMCIPGDVLPTVDLPTDPEFVGIEPTIMANYIRNKQGKLRPIMPNMLLQNPPPPPVTRPPPPAAPKPGAPPPAAAPVPMTPVSVDLHKIWSYPDQFAAVYPELVARYKELKARIDAPGCAQCVKNSLMRQLLQEVDKVATGIRNYAPLQAVAPEIAEALKKRTPDTAPWAQRGPRPTCLNCVRKHVGQAIEKVCWAIPPTAGLP